MGLSPPTLFRLQFQYVVARRMPTIMIPAQGRVCLERRSASTTEACCLWASLPTAGIDDRMVFIPGRHETELL